MSPGGDQPSFRDLEVSSGQSRIVSFYVPKAETLLFNAFARYVTQYKSKALSTGILQAIHLLLNDLDEDDERKFKAALSEVVLDHAKECKELSDLARFVLRPGDQINKILLGRAVGADRRRDRLIKDALIWFGEGVWEKYRKQFDLKDPDESDPT